MQLASPSAGAVFEVLRTRKKNVAGAPPRPAGGKGRKKKTPTWLGRAVVSAVSVLCLGAAGANVRAVGGGDLNRAERQSSSPQQRLVLSSTRVEGIAVLARAAGARDARARAKARAGRAHAAGRVGRGRVGVGRKRRRALRAAAARAVPALIAHARRRARRAAPGGGTSAPTPRPLPRHPSKQPPSSESSSSSPCS